MFMWNELLAENIGQLASLLFFVIASLISWGLAELAKYIRSKTKNEAIDNALAGASELIQATVKEITETTVKQLKAMSADGKLSAEDAAKVKEEVVEQIKVTMPPKIKKLVENSVGDLDIYIRGLIEQYISYGKVQ